MRAVRAAAGAVAFLTRLPVGRLVVLDGADVARGAPAFPLVGAGVGALAAGVAVGLAHVLPALAAAGVGLAFGAGGAGGVPPAPACVGRAFAAGVTGAMPLDALADTADALTAHGDRALAIMRDHAIGA